MSRIHVDFNLDGTFTQRPYTAEEEAAADIIEQNYLTSVARYSSIEMIEAQITPRRLREALLTEEGAQWLADKEAEIEAERAKL